MADRIAELERQLAEAKRMAALEAESATIKQQQLSPQPQAAQHQQLLSPQTSDSPGPSQPKTQEELDDEAIMALDEGALFAMGASQPAPAPPPAAMPAAAPAPPTAAAAAGPPVPLDPALLASLKRFFGYDEFREGQEDVVNAALAGRDVAVFWATGRGKSLCYQLPALHTGKTSVVVSPLVSLMQDQVTKANYQQGREVAALVGSAQLDGSVEQRAWRGEFALLYVTPEKLACGGLERLVAMHEAGQLVLAAIDEAHCVSEWGHDFRKDYRGLHALRERMPTLPVMALTATAVPTVQQDIKASLRLREPVFTSKQSAFRSNLAISCARKSPMSDGVRADLAPLLKELRKPGAGSTIVYCPTKKAVEEVSAVLQQAGLDADFYHGGLGHPKRHEVHMRFLSGALPVVVATVAFGMGTPLRGLEPRISGPRLQLPLTRPAPGSGQASTSRTSGASCTTARRRRWRSTTSRSAARGGTAAPRSACSFARTPTSPRTRPTFTWATSRRRRARS